MVHQHGSRLIKQKLPNPNYWVITVKLIIIKINQELIIHVKFICSSRINDDDNLKHTTI